MTHITSKDGTKIAFEKTGSGPAMIIVNGALTHRALFGDAMLVAMLSKDFSVYTYDRRGRGKSTDVQPYSVDREIEDIEGIIDHAGGAAYLYGMSSGAALALQTAAKLGPTLVPKLAICDPPYGQELHDFSRQKQRINELVKTGAPGEAATFFLSEVGTPPAVIEGMKGTPDWDAIKKIDFTLAYDYMVLGNGAIPEDLAKSATVPVLVMDGENTLDFMHATADRLAELMPNARRKTLKGQAHQVDGKVLAPVLIEFFN